MSNKRHPLLDDPAFITLVIITAILLAAHAVGTLADYTRQQPAPATSSPMAGDAARTDARPSSAHALVYRWGSAEANPAGGIASTWRVNHQHAGAAAPHHL